MSKAGTFKAIDVTRLYKAAKAAGVDPSEVEIEVRPDGAIVMRPASEKARGLAGDNPWDAELNR